MNLGHTLSNSNSLKVFTSTKSPIWPRNASKNVPSCWKSSFVLLWVLQLGRFLRVFQLVNAIYMYQYSRLRRIGKWRLIKQVKFPIDHVESVDRVENWWLSSKTQFIPFFKLSSNPLQKFPFKTWQTFWVKWIFQSEKNSSKMFWHCVVWKKRCQEILLKLDMNRSLYHCLHWVWASFM